jgi:hypothetical protein
MWQEAAFFRAVAHYGTFGLRALYYQESGHKEISARKMAAADQQAPCFSKSPENLQKNNNALKLALKRTVPHFSRYFANDTPVWPKRLVAGGRRHFDRG